MTSIDFEQNAAFLIHDTARLIRRRFDLDVRDLDLTQARWRVLAWLNRCPGLSQSELAERLDIEKAPLGLTLDRLEGGGWIRREPDPVDRRTRRVFLEPQAEPTLQIMKARFQAAEASYLRGFDEDELHELLEALQALRTCLRQQDAPTDAPGTDSGTDTFLGVLFECSRLLTRRFDARLAEMGFTRQQWLVLNTVERREGLRQTELSEAIGLGGAAVGKLVDALQRTAWLERRPDPEDRRANRLHLTRRARHVLGATRERFEQLHAAPASALSPGRQQVLVSRLGWIRHRLLEEQNHTTAEARRAGART
jgi:DNA-binding MarR family transcriptional regulator